MASKYIFQLRRGTVQEWLDYEATKYIETTRYVSTTTYYSDKSGTIANPQPTQIEVEGGGFYIKNPQYLPPQEAELVLVYDNGTPRLKIGNDNKDCSQLPYVGLDSFILPVSTKITLRGGDAWTLVSEKRYVQDITDQLVGKITENSKVDLQPTPEQLSIFHEKDLTFVTENEDGVAVSVYCVGQIPQSDYTIQAVITEIMVD